MTNINDCVHPRNNGCRVLDDWWYDAITQIPDNWVQDAKCVDPVRPADENGGLDPSIPAPDWGSNPIVETSRNTGKSAADKSCRANPVWEATGKIANGVGRNGEFKWKTGWNQLGQIVEGIGRDGRYVR